MDNSSKRTGLLIAGGAILLLVVAGLFVVNHFGWGKAPAKKEAAALVPPPPAATPVTSDGRMWDVMAALANLDLRGPGIPPDKTPAELAQTFGADPDKLLAAIQAQIVLVPYEGSMAELPQIFEGGMANSLDRARLLRTLLAASGTQARIVSVRADEKNAVATYASSSHAALPIMKPEAMAAVQKEVAELTPAILSKLSGGANLAGVVAAAKPEQRLYWVQIQRSGQWADLIGDDLKIGAAQRASAQFLSDAAEASLAWQVKLTVTNMSAGDSPGKGKDVLNYSARASDLNAAPVTFLNRPDGSLTKFVPTLLVGDKKVEGTGFAWNANGKELRNQLLKIDVLGPTEARHFVRVLVGDRGPASEPERGLEIASSAQITVLTGIVSDAQFERAIAGDLSPSTKALFHQAGTDQNQDPANSASVPAIAVLDASHRCAGQIGDASKQVLAFLGRPSIALDRDFVEVSGDSLVRSHSFDLVDPGHSLYGANVSTEILLRAATEQSAIDALLEDWMTSGKNIVTSRRVIKDLLSNGANISSDKPSAGLTTDDFGKLHPAYRTASAGPSGVRAGWRVDPGPQVVSILGDGSGGALTRDEYTARMNTLCAGLGWGKMLVPTEIFPPGFLLGGIVKYDCELAKAYTKSADVLNGIAAQIGGEPAPSGATPDDVAKQIKKMTDDLIKSIVEKSLTKPIKGLGVRGLKEIGSSVLDSVVRPLASAGGDYIASKIGGGLGNGALSSADAATVNEAVQAAERLVQGGSSVQQLETFFQNHGH